MPSHGPREVVEPFIRVKPSVKATAAVAVEKECVVSFAPVLCLQEDEWVQG